MKLTTRQPHHIPEPTIEFWLEPIMDETKLMLMCQNFDVGRPFSLGSLQVENGMIKLHLKKLYDTPGVSVYPNKIDTMKVTYEGGHKP